MATTSTIVPTANALEFIEFFGGKPSDHADYFIESLNEGLSDIQPPMAWNLPVFPKDDIIYPARKRTKLNSICPGAPSEVSSCLSDEEEEDDDNDDSEDASDSESGSFASSVSDSEDEIEIDSEDEMEVEDSDEILYCGTTAMGITVID